MSSPIHAVYGLVPRDLVEVPDGSLQCSPRHPGTQSLAEIAAETISGLVMHAPASTLERRHEMALALRVLRPGAPFVVLAAKTKGGSRLSKELQSFGCEASGRPKRHHNIVDTVRPQGTPEFENAIASAIDAGAPRRLPDVDLWSMPGVFSWDRIDPGSQLLIDHLPKLAGRGADLGCGIGILARAVMAHGACEHLFLIDVDRRAGELAQRNNPGDNLTAVWADVRSAGGLPGGLDFVVCNPPFHDGGEEDKALGQAFIARAAGMLKTGGALWLTANRHLPYEAVLNASFASVESIDQAQGYKIFKAVKGAEGKASERARVARHRE
ncbi:MAG: class I SAM-dependent methyltransferase [Alphaproteobacteria bacterium]|nr:class I SAM-dependent methyltransferase [Alphaproteobacteria bacterium]